MSGFFYFAVVGDSRQVNKLPGLAAQERTHCWRDHALLSHRELLNLITIQGELVQILPAIGLAPDERFQQSKKGVKS